MWKELSEQRIMRNSNNLLCTGNIRTSKHYLQMVYNNFHSLVYKKVKIFSLFHLGLYLDEKLNFCHHIKEKISKTYRGIGVIKKLQTFLTRQSLLTIYKSFIRPHLDYGDVVYDQPHNETFCSKLESVQYNAALAITGAIRGTSQTKLYVELGFEFLKARRWFRRLCYVYKFKSYGLPSYLFQLIPHESHSHNTHNSQDIPTYNCRTDSVNNSFFPWTICEWNKLDLGIRKSTYSVFRQYLPKVIRPQPSANFNVCNFPGLRLLTRL